MYVDFMLFAGIALTIGVLILLRILNSNMRYQEKGFLRLIILAICHNIIDLFWGLTYFDKIEMGFDAGRDPFGNSFCHGYRQYVP